MRETGAILKKGGFLPRLVPHLVIADCASARVPAEAISSGFKALATDPKRPQLYRVTRLDLEKGPRLNRLKTLVGIGWHARDVLSRLGEEKGDPVDEVIELCGCGDHHLLGLGRAGMPAVRWVPAKATGRPDHLDVLAAREGTRLTGGSVAYTQRVPGTQVECIPLPEEEEELRDPESPTRSVTRAVEEMRRIFAEERGGPEMDEKVSSTA